MFKSNDSKKSPLFCYEPNELKTYQAYEKKKVRDKFFRKSKKSTNIRFDGVFNFENNIIEFIPNIDNEVNRGNLYQDSFLPKWAISKDIVKSILFRTKNSDKLVTKNEIINKNYREFIIYTYDYRVIRYRRLFKAEAKVNEKEYVRFYQKLISFIFTKDRSSSAKLPKKMETYLIKYEYYEQKDSEKVSIKIEKYSSIDLSNRTSGSLGLINSSRLSIHENSKYLEYSNSEDSKFIPLNRKEILESYDKLFLMCTPQDLEEFKQTDKKWLSRLSETEWMNQIRNVLCNVDMIIHDLANSRSSYLQNKRDTSDSKDSIEKRSVDIYFNVTDDNNSIAYIMASLVGICCSRFNRTIFGFLSCLYSDWIVTGIYKANPLMFSLLLDCIYQLIRVCPLQFEFTEELLICLHDLLWSVGHTNYKRIFPSQPHDYDNYPWILEEIWNSFFQHQILECIRFKLWDDKSLNSLDDCANSQIIDPPIIQIWEFSEVFWHKMYTRWISSIQIEGGSVSLINHINNISLSPATISQYPNGVYSNYPHSIMFDCVKDKLASESSTDKTTGHNRTNTDDTISTDGILDDEDEYDDDKSVTLSVDML